MIDCAELTALGPLTCITQRDYETECTNRNARPPEESRALFRVLRQ